MTSTRPSRRLSIVVLLCAALGLVPLLAKAQSGTESWQSARLGNIFVTGQQPVELRHSTGGESINWTITDFWHKEVETGTAPVTNGTAVIKPRLSAVGYYLLKAVPVQGGQPGRDSYTSFAIVRPHVSADARNNPFGVMTHFAQGMNPEMLPAFKQIGIGSIRDEHYWAQVEKTKGTYEFSPKSDAYMKACEAAGIQPLVAMTFGNPLYDHKDGPSTPAGFKGYADYGQAILDHYGKQIPWLEIWNEYNGTWAPPSAKKDLVSRYTTYTGMLKASYTQIKSTRPDVQVLGGAAVLIPLPYFEGIFKLGGLDYMDGLVIHPYRTKPEGVDKEVADLNALVRKYNKGQTKPIWVTETGRHTKEEYEWETGRKMYEKGRAEGARYLTRMYTLLLKEDVEKIYWYLASDHQSFISMGLLRHHQKEESGMGRYAVAPSYVSYANLIQQLDGAKFVRREAERPYTRAHVYLFQRGADEVRVAWATRPSKIRVRTAGPLLAFNLMGAEIPLAPANGEVVLDLGEDAIFLRGKIAGVTELDTGTRVLASSSDDYSKVQGELIYPTGEKFVGSISTFPPYAVTGRGTVRTNNSLYKGELANGKKQGPGVYTFNVPNDNPVEEAKTQTYTGLFVDNKMHGRGVLTCSEGSASGEFRDDLLYNGSGKMYVGSVLQWGRWVEGIRQNVAPAISSNDAVETAPPAMDAPGVHEAMGDISASQNPSPPVVQAINSQNMLQGYYTLQVTSSATITGHFVDNNLVGHGVYTHKRKGKIVTYKGPFLNNKPHGTGVTTTMDGVWQSTFENGTQTFGTFTNHEGTHKYVGETVGFNFNGKGKYEYLDYSYDGDFKMGVRHGYGVFTKKDVFFYAGNWVDNKRHGYGVNVNKQHTYKGMHYNDLQHGEGELIYNQGYTYKGTFSKGYMTHGVITTAWGDSHSGEFTRGVRSGKGVFTFREGVSISGTWVDGKLQGVATISSPTSTPATAPTLTNTDGEASIVVTTAPAAPPRSAQGYFENNVLQYQVTDNDSADQVADSLWNTLPVLNNDNNFAPIRGFLSSQVTSEYGSSRILFSDQRVYAGVVTDGKMNGTGMLYSGPSDAKTAPFGKYRLQGVFQNNLPYNCKGVLMDRGTLFQGTWTDGVRQGYAKIVQFNGRLLEGEYVNGTSWLILFFIRDYFLYLTHYFNTCSDYILHRQIHNCKGCGKQESFWRGGDFDNR